MNGDGRTCVIFNPKAGRGRAQRWLDSALREMKGGADLRPTSAPGHGEELARAAAEEGFGTVVAAGGDGTVHEVANGVLRSGQPEVVFSVWPIGSANDYAFTLGLCSWWKGRKDRQRAVRSVDVGRVEGGGRSRFFVNGMGLGFNGAVTLESRKISWLRGMPLYGLAILRALCWHFDRPPMRVSFDGRTRETPTLALTVNLAQREGGFPLTPDASLTDGLFDYVHAGPLRRRDLIRLMPAMATGRLPTDRPDVWLGRCREVRVESSVPLRVHLDGEFFCHPEDGIRELRAEVLPGRLRVETFGDGVGPN